MKLFKTHRDYENIHILFWLMKDNAWCHDWHWLGMMMIVPTLIIQIHLTWLARRDFHEIFHCIAVLFWICANAIWMTGEFFYDDNWRYGAQWFFGAGLVSVGAYYALCLRKSRQ
jgi:hypothetical protein